MSNSPHAMGEGQEQYPDHYQQQQQQQQHNHYPQQEQQQEQQQQQHPQYNSSYEFHLSNTQHLFRSMSQGHFPENIPHLDPVADWLKYVFDKCGAHVTADTTKVAFAITETFQLQDIDNLDHIVQSLTMLVEFVLSNAPKVSTSLIRFIISTPHLYKFFKTTRRQQQQQSCVGFADDTCCENWRFLIQQSDHSHNSNIHPMFENATPSPLGVILHLCPPPREIELQVLATLARDVNNLFTGLHVPHKQQMHQTWSTRNTTYYADNVFKADPQLKYLPQYAAIIQPVDFVQFLLLPSFTTPPTQSWVNIFYAWLVARFLGGRRGHGAIYVDIPNALKLQPQPPQHQQQGHYQQGQQKGDKQYQWGQNHTVDEMAQEVEHYIQRANRNDCEEIRPTNLLQQCPIFATLAQHCKQEMNRIYKMCISPGDEEDEDEDYCM